MFDDKDRQNNNRNTRNNKNDKKLSVAEKSRLEREKRSKQREEKAASLLISKIVIGGITRLKIIKSLNIEINNTLEKISSIKLLLASRNVIFCPPFESCDLLVRQFNFCLNISSLNKGTELGDRLIQVCSNVLIPSLESNDIQKNVGILWWSTNNTNTSNNTHERKILKFFDLLCQVSLKWNLPIRKIDSETLKIDESHHIILQTLILLVDKTSTIIPFEMLINHFMLLLNKYLGALTYMHYDEAMQCQAAFLLYKDKIDRSRMIGDIILSAILNHKSKDESKPKSSSSSSFDSFALIQQLFERPFFAMILSKSMIGEFIQWPSFGNFLDYVNIESDDKNGNNSNSKVVFDNSTLNTLGNLSTLFCVLSRLDVNEDSKVVAHFLHVLRNLMVLTYLPGLYQGNKSVVMWAKSGVTSGGTAVAPLLTVQILRGLFDGTLMSWLCSLILAPLRPYIQDMIVESDINMMQSALDSSAVSMMRKTMTEQIAEEKEWTVMKWAKSLFKGGKSSSNKNKKINASSIETTTYNNNDDDIEVEVVIPDQKALENLLSLWSLLIPHAACSTLQSIPWTGLTRVSFTNRIVDLMWACCQYFDVENILKVDTSNILDSKGFKALSCFSSITRMVLSVTDDDEIYEKSKPLHLLQIIRIIRILNRMVFRCIRDHPHIIVEPTNKSHISWQYYTSVRSIVAVLGELHARWSRKPYCDSILWEVKEANTSQSLQDIFDQKLNAMTILRIMPWTIKLRERFKFFREIIDKERIAIQGGREMTSERSGGYIINIRRNMVLEDGLNAMYKIGNKIKERLIVKYINQFGMEESGIDVGGLFKDFWVDFSDQIFQASFGLFSETSEKFLYPNPMAKSLYDQAEMIKLYTFVGMVVGKALFEDIIISPQFAQFFLSFATGKYNFMHLFDDLYTLDKDLQKNLVFLKNYDGDVSDLGLTFSLDEESLGERKTIPLIPNGSNIDVTNNNLHQYINLTAKYYLKDRIDIHASSFFKGLYSVIHPDILSIFCGPELQVLISGAQQAVDIDDMKKYTQYASGYHSLHMTIQRFWNVVNSMTDEDKGGLLRFVTSCERAPILGFSALTPAFTIQRTDGENDTRLPSASTCFNILKLPDYSSERVLKTKLLMSIRSKSGFDLS